MSAIQQAQVIESLCLQSYQHAGQQFLVSNGITFQTVGHHIINVLDEYHISIQVVQVFNQRTVTTRTEEQFALVAERLVLHVRSHCIRTRLLFRETYMITDAILSLIFRHLGIHQLLEQLTVFR